MRSGGEAPPHTFRGGALRFLSRAALTAFAFLACAILPAQASARGLDAYDVTFENGKQLEQLARAGFDMTEARRGNKVEVVATTKQAKQLRSLGLKTDKKTTGGVTRRMARAQRDDGSWDVYRPYFDTTYVGHVDRRTPRRTPPDDLRGAHERSRPRTRTSSSRSNIGTTVNGKPILALKVTKNARKTPRTAAVRRCSTAPPSTPASGSPPRWTGGCCTTSSTATARHDPTQVDTKLGRTRPSCGSCRSPTPTATTTRSPTGNRLWRKNLRDNNGDGADHRRRRRRPQPQLRRPSGATTTRAPRPIPASETYRGAAPGLRARDQGARRPARSGSASSSTINYHSAAELLLYGVGWQVATPSPGRRRSTRRWPATTRNPAVPGYDPDISAELYTTNGETDRHTHETYGTLGFTPEMSHLRDGVATRPGRRSGRRGLRERLQLPGRRGADPGRVREEHPVRALRRRVGAATRTTRSRVVGRTRAGLRRRPFDGLLRRPADGRGRPPSARSATSRCSYAINGGRDADASTARVEGRRAVRRRPTTSTTPSTAARSPAPSRATRSRCGSPAARRGTP